MGAQVNRARLAMKRIQSHVNPRYSPEYTEKGRVNEICYGQPTFAHEKSIKA